MIERNPILALALTTVAGIAIIVALYLSLTDPGPPPESEEERFERVHRVMIEAFAGGAAWSGRVEVLGLQSGRSAAHTPGWQITGTQGACDASGSYVIRDRPANSLIITAPHSESDARTGELAQLLFEEASARGAAWNSAPRSATEECESGLDLTANRWNPFSAFALAFADAHRDGIIVQLHGIEGSSAAQSADLLIGNGAGASTQINAMLGACLGDALEGLDIRISSSEKAQNNAQGQVLRRGNHSGFVYMELSDALRASLVNDNELRGKFASCLVAASETDDRAYTS